MEIAVNSTEDATIPGDGKCTLREAINNANSDADTTGGDCVTSSGADTIKFSVSGSIGLGSELPAISKDLTISGPGASSLTISGDSDGDGKGNVPILTLNPGVSLALDNLTLAKGLRSGEASASGFGGGIYNNGGTLTITNSTFSGNSAGSSSPSSSNSAGGLGGGIYNNGGTLSISNSNFSGNRATISYYTGGNGGGIFNKGGKLSISNSTFSDNRAGSDSPVGSGGAGGGIYNEGGTLTISNSTFFRLKATSA